MDRLNVSLAALQMNQELKFSATVYGLGAGAFYLGRLFRRHELGAERRQGLAHRGEIAGAVVHERDHNNPFVLGSIFASRLSFAQATRSALANALNTASM